MYGQPVDGTVIFKFGVKDRSGKTTFIGRTKLKALNNGVETYQFSSHEFRAFSWFPDIDGNRFVVEATVTESATAKKEKVTSDESLFAAKPYKISFAKSFKYFKPNAESLLLVCILIFEHIAQS